MGTARIERFFGSETDPATSAPAAVASTASSASAPSNGQQLRFRSRDFDASTDEGLFFYLPLLADYSSGGSLVFKWLTTATSGNVVWKTGFVVVHPASEGSPTDLDAAAIGTITAASAVAVPSTAGHTKETSIALGVTGAHAGDLLVVYLGRDADHASDTAAADVRLLEPFYLTYATV